LARFHSRSGAGTGSTPEAALEGIPQVVADVVADSTAGAEPVPEPIPIRQCSGRFVVRIAPELHRRLSLEAAEAGTSLNRLATAKLGQ
jgi:predicted HicB family RNase H-like nuclease